MSILEKLNLQTEQLCDSIFVNEQIQDVFTITTLECFVTPCPHEAHF